MSLAAEFMDQWEADIKAYGQYRVHPYSVAEDALGLSLVHSEIVDNLRWSNLVREIFHDKATDSYVELVYEVATGEEGFGAEEMGLTAYDVVPQQVSKTVYQRI